MRRIEVILLTLLLLTACGVSGEIVEVPVTVEIPVTVEVTVVATQAPILPPDETAATLVPAPVVYYYFPALPSDTLPDESVAILPDSLILSPIRADFVPSTDPSTNVFLGLQSAIDDPGNPWTGDLKIDKVSYSGGKATILLSGEILGAGDVVLIAARWQLLLTIFGDEAVQEATAILNGESIANVGISHDSQAKPAGYVFTREEVESFIEENGIH